MKGGEGDMLVMVLLWIIVQFYIGFDAITRA